MEWLTSCDECKMNLGACGEHTEQKALSQIGLHEESLQYISNILTKDNEFKYGGKKTVCTFCLPDISSIHVHTILTFIFRLCSYIAGSNLSKFYGGK